MSGGAGFNGGIDSQLLARALAEIVPGLRELLGDAPTAAADIARPLYRFFLDAETQRRVMRRYTELLQDLPEDS